MTVQAIVDQDAFLKKTKSEICDWAKERLVNSPFVVAVVQGKQLCWRYQETKKSFTISTEAGIYAFYAIDGESPLYIGEGNNLKRRVEYHFRDNASSNVNSTAKKSLLKQDIKLPFSKSLRVRCFPLAFGRKEIEEYLHQLFEINTGRKRSRA